MRIIYTIRKKQSGENIHYEMTTKNGSYFGPITSLHDLHLYLKQKCAAVDQECDRVVKEVQEKGESSLEGPDGEMFKI